MMPPTQPTKTMFAGKAMNALRKTFKEDPAYAWSWHCNIAMAMYDEFPDSFWVPDRSEQLKIANKAAARFMKLAFDVENYAEAMVKKDD